MWFRKRVNVRKSAQPVAKADLSLRVILCDTSERVVDSWLDAFGDAGAVEIVRDDLFVLKCDALVSPANSFGDMDGGIDKRIDDYFGGRAQTLVKEAMAVQFCGELPVGMALVIYLGHSRFPYLISAPTMRVPGDVSHSINAYLAMRAVLVAILRHNLEAEAPIKSVAVPGLGTGVGRIPTHVAAAQMRAAYDSIIGEEWRSVVHSAMAPFSLLW